jgi:hypothetical protein
MILPQLLVDDDFAQDCKLFLRPPEKLIESSVTSEEDKFRIRRVSFMETVPLAWEFCRPADMVRLRAAADMSVGKCGNQ